MERFTDAVTAGNLKAGLTGTFRFELAVLAGNLRRMVAELKNKLGFAQGVLTGIPAPCSIVGPDNRILWVNSQVMELLGLPGDTASAKGLTSGELFYGDPDRETLSQKTIREGRSQSVDIDYTTRAGNTLHLHVNTTLFYDMDDALLGCVIFWNDQTAIMAQASRIESQNAVIARAATAANEVAEGMASAAAALSGQIEQASTRADEQSPSDP